MRTLNSLFVLCIALIAFFGFNSVQANPEIVRDAGATQDKQSTQAADHSQAAEDAQAAEHWRRGWGRGYWGGYGGGFGYPGYNSPYMNGGYGLYNPYLYY